MQELKPLDTSNRYENEKLIVAMLKEYYPDLDVGPGTPFYEMVVRPNAFLWSRHSEGIKEVILGTSFANPELMQAEDLDRMMTRTFEERKVGKSVYGVVRLVLNSKRKYSILEGTVFSASGDRAYFAAADTYILPDQLTGDDKSGYIIDLQVVSDGTGNKFNGKANESVTPPNELEPYVKKCYFPVDTTDGGVNESNLDFFNRIKNNVTLKNLTTYRGVRAVALEKFNLKDIVVVGLRDPEMRRDLYELPSESGVFTIHRGSMNDTYVRNEPYVVVSGYTAPLGFPYSLQGISVATNPDGLLNQWNALQFPDVDIYTRGSSYEVLPLSPNMKMSTLTSSIKDIQNFFSDGHYEALHSDDMIKQMWPLVTRIKVKVSGNAPIDAIKTMLVYYISGLRSGQYPQVGNIINMVKEAGATYVHLPVEVEAYYLKENLVMEKIGLNKQCYPEDALLQPLEDDSLMFKCRTKTQMSIRTCFFYTNKDLITVEVV